MANWKSIIGKSFNTADFEPYVQSIHLTNWHPRFVVLHNTVNPRLSEWHQVSGAQRMLNLAGYYRDKMRWSAGPHLFIADDLIWVFTPLNTPGVHSPSWNAFSWGVEMVGDYSKEPFTEAVKTNTVAALAALHSLAGIDPHTLRLHKEDPKTTHDCPGKAIDKNNVIASVVAALASNSPGEHMPGAAG